MTQGPADLLARVPVVDLVLLVFVIGAGLSIARGLRAARRELIRSLPVMAALVIGTAAVWARSRGALETLGSQLGVLAAVAVLLALNFALERRDGAEEIPARLPSADGRPVGPWRLPAPWGACLLAALVLAGGLLCWRLPTFASSTLVWESPVTDGFGEAFRADVGVAAYALRNLVWNDGLVSNGQDSLLYGAPTYALMRLVGFSTLTLRIFASAAALLFVIAMFAFTRRQFGVEVGAVATILAALSTYTILYGKYGTSLAATLLLCTVGAAAAGCLVGAGTPKWWAGPLAGLTLFLATLHYSPGRLVVVVILLSLAPSLVRAVTRKRWRALVAFAGMALVLAVATLAQFAVDRQHSFLQARGEQVFAMLDQSDYVFDVLARDVPEFTAVKRWAVRNGLTRDVPNPARRSHDRRISKDQLSAFEKFEFVFKVVASTLPQCNRLLSPFTLIGGSGQRIFDDPPLIKPYFAPLAAFTLLGLAGSVRGCRRWPHALLLGWFAIVVLPVLLTTRLDAHRIVLSVVPLIAWTALGGVETGRVMGRLGVSARTRAVLGSALAILLLIGTGSVVLRRQVDGGEHRRVLEACDSVSGPVVVGALIDHRQRAWIELGLLERTRRAKADHGEMLDETIREDLAHAEASWPRDLLDRVQAICAHSSLVLAPADAYTIAVDRLRTRGMRVSALHQGAVGIWLLPMQVTKGSKGILVQPTAAGPH